MGGKTVQEQREFEKLIIGDMPRLRRIALSRLKNEADADDLVSDVVVRMLRCRQQFEPGTNFQGWASVILFNIIRDKWRGQKRHGEVATDPDDFNDASLGGSAAPAQHHALELKQTVNSMDRLLDSQRRVLHFVMDGLSYEQIAEIEKIPTGTVRSRLARGRTALREIMGAT